MHRLMDWHGVGESVMPTSRLIYKKEKIIWILLYSRKGGIYIYLCIKIYMYLEILSLSLGSAKSLCSRISDLYSTVRVDTLNLSKAKTTTTVVDVTGDGSKDPDAGKY